MAWAWSRWTCGMAALLALPAATAASIELRLVDASGGQPVAGLVPQLLRLDGAPSPAPLALGDGAWRFDGLAAGTLHACARSDADE